MKEEEFMFLRRSLQDAGSRVTMEVSQHELCEVTLCSLGAASHATVDALVVFAGVIAPLYFCLSGFAATPTSTLRLSAVRCNVRETPLGRKLDIFRTLTK